MLSKGYAATSVNDVCKDAGLTKGSLFHYFATKEDLGAAVLDQYLAQVFVKLDAVQSTRADPLDRVWACLDFLTAAAQEYPLKEGCLLGRFTQELAQTNPRFRSQCAAYFDRWIDLVAADFETANKARRIGLKDVRSLAQYTLAAFEGALILAKASGDRTVVRTTLEHTRRHLAQLFDPVRARE